MSERQPHKLIIRTFKRPRSIEEGKQKKETYLAYERQETAQTNNKNIQTILHM